MQKIKLRLRKKWGGYAPGDVVQFDDRKALPLIANGTGERVGPETKPLNVTAPPTAKAGRPPGRRPKAETATLPPVAETADKRPELTKSALPGGDA